MDICVQISDYILNYRVEGVIRKEDKLLVQVNPLTNHITLPGGRCKIGEDSKNTIIREIKEEMGLDIAIKKEIGMIENFFTYQVNNKKYHEILITYELEFIDKDIYNLDNIKNIEKENRYFEWISINDLKNLNFHPSLVLDIIDSKEFKHLIIKEQVK